MNKNIKLKETYNKIAKDWNGDHIIDTWWMKGADIFLSLLPNEASVLDIGCAGGFKTNYIKEKGFKVEGIDFSENMTEDARERFKDIYFRVMDIYDLDKLDKKYDGIFIQAVLLHIPKSDILDILNKVKSKLKDNGILHIAVKEKKNNGVEEEIKTENDYGYEYDRFFSYYSMDEFKNYFNKLGLKVIYEDVINSGRANWLNIIGRK